ncbi:hypothetical protein [Bacillus toyonensis]
MACVLPDALGIVIPLHLEQRLPAPVTISIVDSLPQLKQSHFIWFLFFHL